MKENYFTGIFADCYVLCDFRNENFIFEFLNHFAPNRETRTDVYEFPQYSLQTEITFYKVEEIIGFLIQNNTFEYSIYWKNTNENNRINSVMVFFTNDSQIILGLSCDTKENDTELEENYLDELKKFSRSQYGYITYETPPELDTNEFIKKVNLQ